MTTPNVPPLPAPPTAAQEYTQAGVSPEQQQAFAEMQNAQTPAEYMAAAARAGLTAGALQAAGAQASAGIVPGPVTGTPETAPFEQQLAAANQRNTALQAQITSLTQQFQQAIAGLQSQMAGVQAAMPKAVDPVTESAGKVAQAFKALPVSDAKNILHSALSSHLVALGLADLAKLL